MEIRRYKMSNGELKQGIKIFLSMPRSSHKSLMALWLYGCYPVFVQKGELIRTGYTKFEEAI
jgi:hypothetical protein